MHDSRSAGKATFARKPQQFGRRLTKLVRKDLEPADDHGHGDDVGRD
jgi:hypothetical protein